jgi:UDPglucose 6-dehydrogenase
MREASSRVLMEALWEAGAKVRAYDPQAMEEARRIYGERPTWCSADPEEALLRAPTPGAGHRVAGVPQPDFDG